MKNYLTASISASAIRHNVGVLRKHVGDGVELCLVVKDDCYGHGMNVLYPLLAELVDGFAVASPVEALELRQKGYHGFVLCFLSAYFDDFEVQDELVWQEITQTVMSKSALASIQEAARRVGKTAPVHLKVDTGMGRMGIPAKQAPDLIEAIRACPDVRLTGIYTHFATADEQDRSEVFEQLTLFKSILPPDGNLVCHAANSAAIIDFPETHFNMVRPGLAVYGCHPSEFLSNDIGLKPCMSVKAKLIAVKHVREGSHCGYGLSHTFDRDSRVGIVPIGYGDGYFRCLSGKAIVRVNGQDAPVCGRVSMDQMTVDVTDIPDVQVGDDVEIISSDSSAPNSVENLARLAGTIPYEITCHLGHNIIRHVLVD
ncbi:alanine racemase [Pontiella sulfatireligans]|uniref:Alanine racemase n=1 Tax=Pontiella sulfatireligans TaxID=2750658 RepID=A0A6C2UGZ3_9BACT|nr:alanine racemase [Pontiella sulfatireligans]VGO19199.1 Alanine racemase 1 [Pontiella sulfatireligans]